MNFNWSYVIDSLPALLLAARVTLAAAVLAVIVGMIFGFGLAILRGFNIPWLNVLIDFYISFARGTPLFIQILIIFYILPVIGLDLPRFESGVAALSLNTAAYIAEILRGGLTAIPPGQIEAARAMGFSHLQIWRRVLLPQTFFIVLPPLTVEFTAIVKASALLSVIGVVELTRTGQQLVAASFQPVETWLVVGAIYFVICFTLARLTRQLEHVAAKYRA
jgi:polar amino acid transport system permease protein